MDVKPSPCLKKQDEGFCTPEKRSAKLTSRDLHKSAPRSSFLNVLSIRTLLLNVYQILSAEKYPKGYAKSSKTFSPQQKPIFSKNIFYRKVSKYRKCSFKGDTIEKTCIKVTRPKKPEGISIRLENRVFCNSKH